ncbi:hypothetical protein IVB14_29000 [Bradyrhizobium sp. 180]|uniref:DUF6505 family protein n=1 Tax=unclassified Bradyrhizobium TaxID=2631580 RepID=UPI001FF96EB2|nr:hypothetical protein [Bradyrhizobium sp. CW12]MCK1494343.1 hypothetical protein [Bradyrhizobium sp. 180]MCK1530458.1 hypothetical protein [Bradyrhizobium sp. 182]MCK1594968.1 hypothetical protein [Bradyrhizobium sp. 164]MCK1615665.1 hypothetical protein [Bradyrhizobium sp. 159]MCK1645481.1 hypothetical protein [Bradyrhizobium sp. 154]MCK1755962.1 hypothetical protein [Bradyrhizobium sp. 137]
MKLLRTIALDPSDTFVFDVAAEPGEWAVSGAFRFWDCDGAKLEGKARAAFRGGFLGVQSWGWSTLAQIVPATEDDYRSLIDLLARQLIDRFGAPDMATAMTAAEEEVAFSQSLCSHPISSLIAVHRTSIYGEVRESFRRLKLRVGQGHSKAFSFMEVEDDVQPDGDVRLADLGREPTVR